MSIKPSGMWCDLCGKPMALENTFWHIKINGEEGFHSCDDCKNKREKKD